MTAFFTKQPAKLKEKIIHQFVFVEVPAEVVWPEFIRWADIDEDRLASIDPTEQFPMIDALQVLVGEMGPRRLRHLSQLHLGQPLQFRQEL